MDARDRSWDDERADTPEINVRVAHSARMYDYYLGGKTNFDADREAAANALRAFPSLFTTARENRGFLLRVVAELARRGVRQFLDIGTGIPVEGRNTHDAAQAVAPESRVVYVDNDPIVLAHARALLTGDPRGATAYIQADLRAPESIWADPALRATVDFTEPIAVLLIAIMHFVPDEQDPHGVLARLTGPLPAGSFLALSHVTHDFDPVGWAKLVSAYQEAGIPAQPRTGGEIEGLFPWPVLAPGVISVAQWNAPVGGSVPGAAEVSCYGGMARKP
ncbi:SAM-dependent methyltransferase [Streptomyces sp. SID3343]|uniref:SAM-dependent methyltransferase n=1 Tax=Streptomyces sp. SID3343 TaxID=2690260 RepID=UPI00136E8C89|nr:SAM-dependent methyltransferase [Streptomyces sp. SID3343]MYW05625.1 SAM-dependent methyltransferase [Streptomyces sp. SID3343]